MQFIVNTAVILPKRKCNVNYVLESENTKLCAREISRFDLIMVITLLELTVMVTKSCSNFSNF